MFSNDRSGQQVAIGQTDGSLKGPLLSRDTVPGPW